MTMENKLKPCPFCGGEAEIMRLKTLNIDPSKIMPYYICGCPNCGCWFNTDEFHTEEEAVVMWNTRTEVKDDEN